MHACRASTGTQITTLVKKQAYKELLLAYKMTSFEDRLHEYTVTERNVCTHPMHANPPKYEIMRIVSAALA